ncbi:hypothetical protein FKM82_005897 [Ascaphus truei]
MFLFSSCSFLIVFHCMQLRTLCPIPVPSDRSWYVFTCVLGRPDHSQPVTYLIHMYHSAGREPLPRINGMSDTWIPGHDRTVILACSDLESLEVHMYLLYSAVAMQDNGKPECAGFFW